MQLSGQKLTAESEKMLVFSESIFGTSSTMTSFAVSYFVPDLGN